MGDEPIDIEILPLTTDTLHLLKFLQQNTPELTNDQVNQLLDDHYGLKGSVRRFEAERDQNFKVETGDGNFLFKICNVDEDPEVVDLQIKALQHIARVDPALPVPRALPTLTGEDTATIEIDGTTHIIRLLSFLEGVEIDDEDDTATFRRNTGALLARLDIALRGFFHPAAHQDHPWILEAAPRLLEYTPHVTDPDARANAEMVLAQMRDETLPATQTLRHQVIHQDAHVWNLVVDPADHGWITGVIDFGDMAFAPLITELAVAAHLSGRPDSDPLAIVDLALGYDRVLPLEEAEVDFLYDLALGRMVAGLVISSARQALFPDDDPYGGDLSGLHRRIQVALDRRKEVDAVLHERLGFYTRPRPTQASHVARMRTLGPHSPHFYVHPLHVVSSNGMNIKGADGKDYLDFYNNVPTVGHNHPHVGQAVSRQMATLNTNTRYLYDVAAEYSKRLLATVDDRYGACLFVNSGSEANDVAAQIAKSHTGATGLINVEGAYHGITETIIALSDSEITESRGDIASIELPDALRGKVVNPSQSTATAIEELAEHGIHPAAAYIDPAVTSSGILDLPPGFLSTVAETTRNAHGLVVGDEVQSGFGRTGVMWGHQREDFQPDIITLGKPVGNGHPLGVVISSREIIDGFMERDGLFSTFGGNPVSCAAGIAVLDVIEDEGLVENSRIVGEYLKAGLEEIAGSHPMIGEVRGTGLLIGVELIIDPETKDPAREQAQELCELMREGGVLVGASGPSRNVLKLRPPLVAQPHHIDRFLEVLSGSLSQIHI